ncbi:uracil-DNA glycosylase family protein [Mucilaginibacter boryungensis]|uniref:DUF4918 family protein n=1 Tax=Mucilaginibacter boryungensis TaxID=768480 RepID=A0ABR9XN19_9SPHI|nr:uracil-DNA glycosylase family protein [Mucilaginibacter boryungensis]MBE9668686.1 DUF4918 family protein [Mucilaginibacter boryungensis]
MTFADRVINFNNNLHFDNKLPDGIAIMNPFVHESVREIASQFYKKYYDDNNQRHLVIGINPGRFGGGLTGIPFTDPKRLKSECHIAYNGPETHEPSSVFIYEMIKAYGGPERFYSKFYFNSAFPLGFVKMDNKGKEVNYNYYDSPQLIAAVRDDIINNIKAQIALGVATDICFCFGTGQNQKFLNKLNEQFQFFGEIIALEHPRFIMQYKSKSKQEYIDKYLHAFAAV